MLSDLQELARLIGLCREESDLLHEVAVKVSAFLFTAPRTGFPDRSKLLAQPFAKAVVSQSWRFGDSYLHSKPSARNQSRQCGPDVLPGSGVMEWAADSDEIKSG